MVITFTDYVPPRRTDGVRWTTIKVEEGPSQTGPWTEIQSFAMTPADSDPYYPIARSWTTTTATLTHGWYRVRFQDGVGNYVYTEPIQNIPPDPVEYLPSLTDVGTTTLGRTQDQMGSCLGTFTQFTSPTDDQVQRLILQAGDDVRRKIGADIPDDLIDDARRIVSIRTAMLIELTMFGSEVAMERSPYPEFKALYDELILDLMNAVAYEESGGSPLDPATGVGSPAYGFPYMEPLLPKKM
jgi:hypothetical protein